MSIRTTIGWWPEHVMILHEKQRQLSVRLWPAARTIASGRSRKFKLEHHPNPGERCRISKCRQLRTLDPDFRAILTAKVGDAGRQTSFTTCLPKFSPFSMPMNALGAFSMPCATLSRYLSLPSLYH